MLSLPLVLSNGRNRRSLMNTGVIPHPVSLIDICTAPSDAPATIVIAPRIQDLLNKEK